MITYRDLQTQEELEQVADLEKAVWTLEDRAIVPYQIMMVMIRCGGHVAGAFDGEKLVGFTMALASRQGDEWRLWSHMAGVSHTHRKQGIGFGLKQYQRQWAMANGYHTIAWTFDPLQRVNANFNLRRLGAIGVHYRQNVYGEMNDGINQGMPSDRLETVWNLASARVTDHAQNDAQPVLVETRDAHFVLRVGEDNRPVVPNTPLTNHWHFAEIPYDLEPLKANKLVLEWRMAMREVMGQAMESGYQAVDFVNSDSRCWYVLFKA